MDLTGQVVSEANIFFLNIGQLETGIVFEGQVFCQIRIKREVLVENLPNTNPAQCGPNWHSSCRRRFFLGYIGQSEAFDMAVMFLSYKNEWDIFIKDLPNIISAKFGSKWHSIFKEFPVFLLSIHHSCKVWLQLAE